VSCWVAGFKFVLLWSAMQRGNVNKEAGLVVVLVAVAHRIRGFSALVCFPPQPRDFRNGTANASGESSAKEKVFVPLAVFVGH
jgi:hypothetical protein